MAAPAHLSNAAPLDGSFVQPLRPRALREMVFEILLQAIVRGEIKEGDWLNHQQLATRFDVSPTPVREALQQLALFGIVENQHNRGTVVRPFGPTQIEEIYYVRALLEADATRLACKKLDSTRLAEIKSETARLSTNESPEWITEVPKVDKQLHQFIAETCGNNRLKEEIFRYHVFIVIPRTLQLQPHATVLAEHLKIMDALINRQADEAAQAMLDHIRGGAKACNELLFRSGIQTTSP
jgi:DNA-binding GntR family transcriptional regulator